MAQTITLEEAATRLGISTDDMKRRLREDWKTLKKFRDGSTFRFQERDIDELNRSLGAASDPELMLPPISDDQLAAAEDFKLPDLDSEPLGLAADPPLTFGSTEEDIFSLSDDPKPPSPQFKPDSDVRLHGRPAQDVQSAIKTEELQIEFAGPGSAVIKGGSSAKLTSRSSTKLKAGDSGKKLPISGTPGDSSEFELSLDADSSDFELQLNADSSDEVELGELPAEPEGRHGAGSGINLRKPADSGISLEKKGGSIIEDDSDEVDFELSLDPVSGPASVKIVGPKSGGRVPITSDSDSEFELTLDDSDEGSSLEAAALEAEDEDKNDIFETDFEIPPMTDESDSEAIALDSDTDLEHSDFELALDESDAALDDETGSEVVLLEDEDELAEPVSRGPKSKKIKRPAAAVEEDVDLDDMDVEVEAGDDVGAALRGVRAPREDEEEDDEASVTAGAAAPAPPWGVIPALFLMPAMVLCVIGGLMGYELVNSMWGYQQPRKPVAPLVRYIAKDLLDMDVRDQ